MPKMISRLVSLAAALTVTAVSSVSVSAAEGRLYNQFDPYWDTIVMHSITGTQSSMYVSACGIFSFCNAIYGLNSTEIDAIEFAEWAAGNGSYRPGNGGTYLDLLYPKVEEGWGERAYFKMIGTYWGTIRNSKLMNHLKSGGVAVIHVYGHFMAVTGYDEEHDLYHVIESACSIGRGLEGDSWVTAEKLSDGKTKVDWFALLENTKAPEYAAVESDYLHPANQESAFLLKSDIRGDFALGIDDAEGTRIGTYYSHQAALSCNQRVQQMIAEPGMYSCYASSYTDLGYIDSEPIRFQVYDCPPQKSELTVEESAFRTGEPVRFTVTGDLSEAFTVQIRDQDNNKAFNDHQDIELGEWFGDTAQSEWIPEKPGDYTAFAVMYNGYGFKYSVPHKLHIDGDLFVDFVVNPDVVQDEQNNSQMVPYGGTYGAYGKLPAAERIGSRFDGWFTDPESGEQVTDDSIVSCNTAHKLYAHWTPYPAGDTVSDMTLDIRDAVKLARIINEDETASADDTALYCADINGDGLIDISDLTSLLTLLS